MKSTIEEQTESTLANTISNILISNFDDLERNILISQARISLTQIKELTGNDQSNRLKSWEEILKNNNQSIKRLIKSCNVANHGLFDELEKAVNTIVQNINNETVEQLVQRLAMPGKSMQTIIQTCWPIIQKIQKHINSAKEIHQFCSMTRQEIVEKLMKKHLPSDEAEENRNKEIQSIIEFAEFMFIDFDNTRNPILKRYEDKMLKAVQNTDKLQRLAQLNSVISQLIIKIAQILFLSNLQTDNAIESTYTNLQKETTSALKLAVEYANHNIFMTTFITEAHKMEQIINQNWHIIQSTQPELAQVIEILKQIEMADRVRFQQ